MLISNCNWLPFYRPSSFASQDFSCFAFQLFFSCLFNSIFSYANSVNRKYVFFWSLCVISLLFTIPVSRLHSKKATFYMWPSQHLFRWLELSEDFFDCVWIIVACPDKGLDLVDAISPARFDVCPEYRIVICPFFRLELSGDFHLWFYRSKTSFRQLRELSHNCRYANFLFMRTFWMLLYQATSLEEKVRINDWSEIMITTTYFRRWFHEFIPMQLANRAQVSLGEGW